MLSKVSFSDLEGMAKSPPQIGYQSEVMMVHEPRVYSCQRREAPASRIDDNNERSKAAADDGEKTKPLKIYNLLPLTLRNWQIGAQCALDWGHRVSHSLESNTEFVVVEEGFVADAAGIK